MKSVTCTWKDKYPSKIVNDKHQRVIFTLRVGGRRGRIGTEWSEEAQ